VRFCLIGAGAIGGFIAARLANSGAQVTLIARGKGLEAIRSNGLRVRYADGRIENAAVTVTDDYATAGKFDAVLLAVKAHQLTAVAPRVEHLCHADTIVVPMQNGVPFWYFHEHGGKHSGRAVEAVDPGGAIRDAIPAHRIIGCVIYIAGDLEAPGRVHHASGERLQLGELDGSRSARLERLAAAFAPAGFHIDVLDDIRAAIWTKLWGNVSFNPVSALTRATMSDICGDEHGFALTRQLMQEAQAVGEALGVRFPMTLERRLEGRGARGRPQDLDAPGRGGGAPDRGRCARGRGGGAGGVGRRADAGDHRDLPRGQAPRLDALEAGRISVPVKARALRRPRDRARRPGAGCRPG
jgi:2-dehydropantoate 2-reductase